MKLRLQTTLFALCLILSLVASFVHPQAALAAVNSSDIQNATLEWQDAFTIIAKVGSDKLIFRNDDTGQEVFRVQNYPCSGTINVTNPPGSGQLDLDYSPAGQAGSKPICQNVGGPGHTIKKSIGQTANADIYYTILNDGSQVKTNGANELGSFTLSSQYPGLYTRDSENSKTCQDIMQVDAVNHEYRIYQLVPQGDSNAGSAAPGNIHSPGCYLETNNGLGSGSLVSLAGNGALLHLGGTVTNQIAPGQNKGGAVTQNSDNSLDCAWSNPLNWIICPVVDGLVFVVNKVDDLIVSELAVGTGGDTSTDQPNTIFADKNNNCSDKHDTCASYYTAWSSFRNIALGLMAVAGLVVVISQALGMEILDAYTIRKILPRILIAAIMITLSWQLMRFFVTLTNDLGYGVRDLIQAPFGPAKLRLNFGGDVGTILIVGVFGKLLGALGLLSFALTGALAVLIAIVVLILRQVAIIALIILAPIAIVAYILPNTQKVYHFWWESFSKALLMFPIIVAFIAAGHIFSAVTLAQSQDLLPQIIGFAAYFAPYFLIPATFRLAGGALRTIGGSVSDRSRGVFGGLSNFRSNQRKKRTANAGQRVRSGNIFRQAPANSRRAGINRAAQIASLVGEGSINPRRFLGNVRAAQEKVENKEALEAAEKSEAMRPFIGNDTLLEAVLASNGTAEGVRTHLRRHNPQLSTREVDTMVGHVTGARKELGDTAFLTQAAIANAGTRTGFAGGAGEMLDVIDRVTGGNQALKINALAAARSNGEKAGRYDLSPSFSESIQHLQAISRAETPADRTAAIDAAQIALSDNVVNTKGPGVVLGGHGNSIRNLLPAVQRRLETTHATRTALEQAVRTGGSIRIQDPTVTGGVREAANDDERRAAFDAADRDWQQALASTAALHDIASQVSPEAAIHLANTVLSARPDGSDVGDPTYMQMIDTSDKDPQFREMRRTYTLSAEQQRQAAQQAAQQQAGQIPNPTGTP